MVLPHPEQAIFRGRSSLSTGIGVAQDGQFTVGTLTVGATGLASTACSLLGLTNAVKIHNIEAPPAEPNTNSGGYAKMYTNAETGSNVSSSIKNLLCLFLVIDKEKDSPTNRITKLIIVNGIGPNNRLSFG